MSPLRMVFVLALAASPAGAQPVESILNAAAEAALSISSLAVGAVPAGAAPSIAVDDFTGSGDAPALVTHNLRFRLLAAGLPVLAPGATAEFDLRGSLLGLDGRRLLTATLWRRSPAALVGTTTVEVGVVVPIQGQPAAPRGAEEEVRRRTFWARAGLAARSSKDAASVGVAYRPGSPRWEAGVDVGKFRDAVSIRYVPTAAFVSVQEHFRFSATYLQVSGSYLHPVSMKYLSCLRAGAGTRLVLLNQEHVQEGAGGVSSASNAQRLMPVFEVGAAKGLWGDVELDVRGEWVPEVRAVGDLTFGGFAASALLGVRLPL